MIDSLSGVVRAIAPTAVVIDVGGVGFRVLCPPTTASGLQLGEPASLHTHLAVREDALTLYGFATTADREAFLLVQTASGVGPKLALAILAVLSAHDLGQAIATGNLAALTRVPGVGKKVAERLVVELKDKVTLLAALATADEGGPGSGPAHADELRREQVVEGLTGLGYSAKEAERAVTLALDDAGDTGDVAALMKAALKHLAR
ncbi:MAG: Holliday junction branch migration protein RuvA [Propionibacteriaceae bacterium]|jgi:Holliday junction DNA helicase RuvA|nr:Holliday junction branch migration protein RuvA [Propionibacteriaceae bacterium]